MYCYYVKLYRYHHMAKQDKKSIYFLELTSKFTEKAHSVPTSSNANVHLLSVKYALH